MRTPSPVPPHLAHRAFSRAEALAAGITSRMLQHPRFVSVLPSVYRLEGVELDDRGWIEAGRLALPNDARVSHLTRLRLSGLDVGELFPMHFTIPRDHHLVYDELFLHRTEKMPPCDRHGVVIAAAFIGIADTEKLLDLICIGDRLLHRDLLDIGVLTHLAHAEPWRPGAAGALAVLEHLDGRSRSLKESEVRAIVVFSGLPEPEVNVDVVEEGELLGVGDLVFRFWKFVLEYEGRQHAFSTRQFARDIDRYAGFRRHEWAYLQATQEMLARPKSFVLRVHDELRRRGYDGPSPVFGARWESLFERAEARMTPRWAVSQQPKAG